MGRIYTLTGFTGLQPYPSVAPGMPDLFEILVPSSRAYRLHEISFWPEENEGFGEAAGDWQTFIVPLELRSGQTTSGTTDDLTPIDWGDPLLLGDPGIAATIEGPNEKTQAGGAYVVHFVWYVNNRFDYRHIFAPEARPVLCPGRRYTISSPHWGTGETAFEGFILNMIVEEIG